MWTYMTCIPGAPGAPGQDGAKGDLGSPGKTGTQGPRGADGKKGAKGEPGIQGSAGQKGERGDKGDSGTPRLASHMNWKECAWKKADGTDSGLIYVSTERHFVTRVKQYSISSKQFIFTEMIDCYNSEVSAQSAVMMTASFEAT